jgi:type IV pilus assembly protein PilA
MGAAEAVAPGVHFSTRRWSNRKLILILVIVAVILLVPLALILAALVIPSLQSSRIEADEASAIATVRSINTAEAQYDLTYGRGFACSVPALAGDPKSGPATEDAAQILPADVSSGTKSGYIFTIGDCTRTLAGKTGAITGYQVTAVPQTMGKTGNRGFCSDESGVIKVDPSGGTNCTQMVQ